MEWGRERKTPSFLFFLACQSRISANSKQKLPVKLFFSAQNEISGENFSRAGEKNTPKKVVFAPKVAEMDEKGRFGVRNHREGKSEKTDFTSDFAML